MKKQLFFLMFVCSMTLTNIVKANNIPTSVELNSCVKFVNTMSQEEIKEMVVALYLGQNIVDNIYGSERLDSKGLNSTITTRSASKVNKSLTQNVVDVIIDGTNYACYPKTQR